jgi:tRNA(Ile)-lysidine synthase
MTHQKILNSTIVRFLTPLDSFLAVAVSGGSDSMALALLLQESGGRVHALHVNHRLRPESDTEAQQVAGWMAAHHIPCTILLVQEDLRVQKNLMAAARNARYRLMTDWCKAHGITTLCTAHHMEDQAETFLMRLSRGSGVDGLSGIHERSVSGGITLFRPLLYRTKEDLLAYLVARGQAWIEDPTNINPTYRRNRFRLLQAALTQEGITPSRLSKTTDHLLRAADCLNEMTSAWVSTHCKATHPRGIGFSHAAFTALHEELRLRVMRHLLREVSGDAHGEVRFDSLHMLVCAMQSPHAVFATRTLHHCQVERTCNDFLIFPQNPVKRT